MKLKRTEKIDTALPTIKAAGLSFVTTQDETAVIVLCNRTGEPVANLEMPINGTRGAVRMMIRRLSHHWLGMAANVIHLI